MAGNHTGRKLQRRRFRTETGEVQGLHGTGRVGGSDVGPNGLQFRQNRERVLPDRSLRKLPEVFGVGEYSGVAGGVHAGGFGLLRREPGRRVQLAGGLTPINGKGNCSVAGCDGDLRTTCPSELALKASGKTVACRSACDVFNTDEYCCRGVYGNPMTCQPTYYSKKFKATCPTAYSYAYDDPTSIFTCSGTDYVVSFCSSRYTIKLHFFNIYQCQLHPSGRIPAVSGWV